MKKKITLIFLIFINIICHSQECLSDQYFKKNKIKNPLLENRIKNVISSFKNNVKNTTNKLTGALEATSDEIIVIPVVFNVIHSGESIGSGRNISLTKIEEQITLMNDAYSGKYGGVDTKIRFCLAKQNTVGQVTTGVNRFFGNSSYELYFNYDFNLAADKEIKRNISPGFPNNLFLNVWVADLKYSGQDILNGYSSFPYTLDDFNTDSLLDGVVLDYTKVGINVTSNPNDSNNSNGSTFVHEAGHWLGLFHIFQDNDNIVCNESNCENQGDMICDTESVPESGHTNVASGNCLGYNCSGQITNVVQNFMDYQAATRLSCRTKFTAGQKKRMRDILSFYRSSIYSQGSLFDLTACKTYSYGGGGSGGCTEDVTLPAQIISRPNIYQDLSQFTNPSIKFGEKLEVNDKWLVTIYNTTAYYQGTTFPSTSPLVDVILIYKREGCRYVLHQMIDVVFSNKSSIDLLLNGNEIIVSSSVKDEVYICRLNESNDTWSLIQQIKNDSSTSQVGTSSYTIGRFLFVLESNGSANNIFRVYYKNNIGTYVFHQIISVPGFNLPGSGKSIQSGNFKKRIVNFNSSTFIGSYDPLEILVSKPGGTGLVLFELNSNNIWTLANTIQPAGMSSSEWTHDIEISKDYIYVLTSAQTTVDGSLHDVLYLYSYKITDTEGGTFPFQNSYIKQVLISYTDNIFFDAKLQIFNDQFLFVDNTRYQPMSLFYNSNFGSTSLPNWQLKKSKQITCANSTGDPDDFEVFGNLLFYGYGGFTINIYNMKDILSREGYNQSFIDNSDFYNKKINSVPENYSTSAQKITIGETSKVEFNYVNKEFIANNNIVLKPGTTIARGSGVKLKITDSYGLCNSIVAKKSNDELDFNDEYLIEVEPEKNITLGNKVVLYPNPNTGIFTVYLGKENDKPISCDIYNSTGQLLYQAITDKSSIEISLPNLSAGNYILKLKGDNYNEVIKFIKE